MKNPLISIICPTFNRREYLDDTFNSIFEQSFSNWELIIVDDGSDLETISYIKHKISESPNARFVEKEVGVLKGANASRNLGAKISRGEYLIFLDSDDILLPWCIERRTAEILHNKSKDFIVFQTVEFNFRPGDSKVLINTFGDRSDDLWRFLKNDHPWITSGPVWKKDSFFAIGGFDESIPSFQDWDINIRAVSSGLTYTCIKVVDNCLRRHTSPTIGGSSRSISHLESHERLFYKLYFSILLKHNEPNKLREHFVKLFFWLCKEWLKHGLYDRAFLVWSVAKNNRLINEEQYVRGSRIFKYFDWFYISAFSEFGLVNRLLNRIYGICFEREFQMYRDKTLRKYRVTI